MPYRIIRLAAVVVGLFGLAVAGGGRAARAWLPDPTLWGPWQAGSGWLGNYVSASRTAAGWVVYSNVMPAEPEAACPGTRCPGLVRYTGPSLVDPRLPMRARVVFRNRAISDVVDARGRRSPARMLTRAVVRQDPTDGTWHAVVHVSDGYGRGSGPDDGRVEPAYMSSRDGRCWGYHGRLGGEVGVFLASGAYWGSSLALVVNPGQGSGVDSKLVLAMDGVLPSGGLALAVSGDGRTWRFLRDAAGRIRNVAPAEVADEALLFPSMVRIGRAWRMVAVDRWPPSRHRHMVSYDGLHWTLLGDPASPSPTFDVRGAIGQKRRARNRRHHALRPGRRAAPGGALGVALLSACQAEGGVAVARRVRRRV